MEYSFRRASFGPGRTARRPTKPLGDRRGRHNTSIEDQIRLHAIALGAKGDDNSIATLLKGTLNSDVTKSSFVFATQEDGTNDRNPQRLLA